MFFEYNFHMSIAGIGISVGCRYQRVMELCSEYITDTANTGSAHFSVSVPESEFSEAISADIPPWYTEFTLLYRCIMRRLPYYGAFAVHGATISYRNPFSAHKAHKNGKAPEKEIGFLFTAPSGTGKSTHIKLWKKYLGNAVDIINGDKPVIKADENGVYVCSTPWAGKEGWHKNRSVRLGAICILTRAETLSGGKAQANSVKRISPGDYLGTLLNQIFISADDPEYTCAVLELFDRVCASGVPFYLLACDISEEAVRTSFNALTEQNYNETI